MRSETIPEFLAALEKPRRVLIMVKAGDPTDAVINELADAMEEGDIIIDGGNALYTDTIRREKAMRERGLHFVGAGISGGEEGALNGPSIMPGGPAESYKSLGPLLEEISAHVDGVPCCTHIGPDGVGPLREDGAQRHRVRRHAADRRGLRPAARRARQVRRRDRRRLHRMEQGRPGQLPRRDHRRGAAPDRRQDRQAARRRHPRRGRAEGHRPLDRQVRARPRRPRHRHRRGGVRPRAVRFGRLSARPTTGLASGDLGEKPSDAEKFTEDVRQALYASKIVAYAQGFNQIQAGSAEYDWGITPGDLATIWRGGCIIRAKFLNRIKEAFDEDPDLPTLIVAPYFRSAVESAIDSWRRVVVTATELGIPIPGFSSALSYYDALRTERLPAALTQGLRDFFGAHTYGRIDADPSKKFHTLWSGDRTEIPA